MNRLSRIPILLLSLILSSCSTLTDRQVFDSSLANPVLRKDIHNLIHRTERSLALLPDRVSGGGIPIFGKAKIVKIEVMKPYDSGKWSERWVVQRAEGFIDAFTVDYIVHLQEAPNGGTNMQLEVPRFDK